MAENQSTGNVSAPGFGEQEPLGPSDVGDVGDHGGGGDPHRSSGSGRRRNTLALGLLVGLTALGLVLRLTGLGFLVPHAWEPDALVLVRHVEYIESGAQGAEADAFYGYYPHLIARLCALTPEVRPAHPPATLDEHLAAASSTRIRLRRALAALSVLLVPGTYLLARRFLRRSASLLAAGLAAFSVLHIWFAQETRPHGVSAVFALFAVLAALELRRRPRAIFYLLAGVALVGAVCSLQSGIATLIPFAVAHVLRAEGGSKRAHAWFAGALALVAASIPVFYPFMFAESRGHDAAALNVENETVNLSGHGIVLSAFDGKGLPVVVGTLVNYEPLIAGLGAIGLVLCAAHGLARRGAVVRGGIRRTWRARLAGREDLAVVLSYVAPYFVVIGMYAHTYQRFVLPLVPFAACFAAWSLYALCDRIVQAQGRIRGGDAAAWLLSIVVLLAQGFAATKLVVARTQPDTAARAAGWLAQHARPGADRIVHSASLDFPLFRTRTALDAFPPDDQRRFPWILYQLQMSPRPSDDVTFDLRRVALRKSEERNALGADPAGFVAGLDADYAVVEVFDDPGRAFHHALREGCQAKGDLVARFSPLLVDTGDDRPLGYQDDDFEKRPVWWWRAILARSMGSVIEIYKLKRSS